ncbi:MAG: ABC transporter permease [Fimbriimonadaceae bacterium]|nr:MAG: ABC transporter permease [Fimbriimonadaceae bacterium]
MVAALESLLENVRSSFLAMVGIAVASMAILLLVSIGLGVQKDITGQIDSLGADLLIVVPGKVDLGSFNPNFAGKSFLTEENASDVAALPGVKQVAQFSFAGGGIQSGEMDAYPIIIGATPSWFNMQPSKLAEGNYFTTDNELEAVCVLGSIAAEELFPNKNAVGQTVTINGEKFKVTGVIKDEKAESSPFSAFSLVNVVYIPIAHIRKNESNVQVDRILIQIDNKAEPKQLVASVSQTLGQRLQDTQYSVLTQEDLLKLVFDVLGILGTLVIGLTSIALAVGGLGIMTVMLMSVGERTKEIGIRMAVGASRKAVFKHFLTEAGLIGLGGVAIGLVVSLIILQIIGQTTSIKPLVTIQTISLTFCVGIGLGCIFGVIPALKAARLHPVEALRNE